MRIVNTMVGLVKTSRYHDPRCHNKQQHWIATTSSSSSTFMGFHNRERSWLRVDACCIHCDLILGTQIIAAFGFFSSIIALFLSYKSLIQIESGIIFTFLALVSSQRISLLLHDADQVPHDDLDFRLPCSFSVPCSSGKSYSFSFGF